MPKKKLKSAVFWKLLTLENLNKVYALVILYTIVGNQLKVELFKPKLFWVCLAFLIVWHFTVIYIKSSRCMGQTVLWTDFWWCGNSSILKAFSFLLPRKKCCGQKKEKMWGHAAEYIAQYFALSWLALLSKWELLRPYGRRMATACTIWKVSAAKKNLSHSA